MSGRAIVGVAALVILGCAAGGYYWMKRSEAATRAAAASSDMPEAEAPAPSLPALGVPPTAASSSSAAAKPGAEPVADLGLPLRSGEVLEYTANVSSLSDVANLKLQVVGRRDFFGKSAWHLQAFAHTENPLRMVFTLDDQFDSYSDAITMASLQYEMHLDERGQKVNSIQRMTSTGREPAQPGAAQTRVLPGTRDPLGMMQFLRNVDWSKTTEVKCPVYDGHKLYDVRARLTSPGEAVTVPAGSYKASKIEIHVFDNGQEMKDAQFTIFIANNVAHTPVELDAVMPFATAKVQLTKAK
jgi:hypothetical protein